MVAETATVLSHHAGQLESVAFLHMIHETVFPVIHFTEVLQEEATNIFIEQTKKGTSMVDCGNTAVMCQLDIQTIFSFDAVYRKRFELQVAQ